MQIKYIVDTVTSARDVSGNRYHLAIITSTATGKFMPIVSVGGDQNAAHLVREITGADWPEIHTTNTTIAKREFKRLNDHHRSKGAKYEHQIALADFYNLGSQS